MGAFLSVVVPACNRPFWLKKCLQALATQYYPKNCFEVVVCDDASAVDLAAVVDEFRVLLPNLRFIRLPTRRGPAATRNLGWRASKGEIIVFLDDDVVSAADHLRIVAEVMTQRGRSVAGVEGRVLPLLKADPVIASPFLHTLKLEGGGHSCNIAYWRRVLESVSGFDEQFTHPAFEDYDLAYRVEKEAGPLSYEPRMLAYHAVHGDRRLADLLTIARNHRSSAMRLFLKHPDRFPPQFVARGWWRTARILLRSPTFARTIGYFVLSDLVYFASYRRLAMQRPLCYLKLCAFVLLDCLSIVFQLPALRAEYRRLVSIG